MHNTHTLFTYPTLRITSQTLFQHQLDTSLTKNTSHFNYTTLTPKLNSRFYFNSHIFFKLTNQARKQGETYLIPSIGCKEALEPENTRITTLLLLDLGFDTIHPSPK